MTHASIQAPATFSIFPMRSLRGPRADPRCTFPRNGACCPVSIFLAKESPCGTSPKAPGLWRFSWFFWQWESCSPLLPRMNADSTGRVSKQEYMRFMEAEFERLDREKKGELDVRKLTQTGLYASHFAGK